MGKCGTFPQPLGTAAALCPRRDTPPPGRRVGFFARVLSFFAVQKKCFPGFSFLPRDHFGHPSTLWRFPYMDWGAVVKTGRVPRFTLRPPPRAESQMKTRTPKCVANKNNKK